MNCKSNKRNNKDELNSMVRTLCFRVFVANNILTDLTTKA